MTKKIRCMIISEDDYKYLSYNLAKHFEGSKKGDFECYIGCMSQHLITKIQDLLKRKSK